MAAPWYQNAVFYQVYVRAFHDSDGDGHGDIAGLRRRLDYLEWLGVDCLWLMPHYPSPLRDDGYDVASYYGVHPQYGQLEDFQLLLEDAHRRGIRIITDLVLNHTSDQHPWFVEARRSRTSPMRDWYVWSDSPDRYAGVPIIFNGIEPSNWTFDEATGQYYWHRFYKSQPDLNYANPAVADAMLAAARYWLQMGVDGFRVDAAPYLFEQEGTLCESLPETHAYIQRMRALLTREFPQAMLLAEACMQPEQLVPYFGQGDEFNMCFNFPVMPRVYLALATGNADALRRVVETTPPLPAGAQWATFLRNHDELNLWLVNEQERAFLFEHYAPLPEQRIFIGIRRRLAPLLGDDPRRIALAHSLLYTLPGAPVMYYGDEIGMGDDVRLSDRNGVRTPMQWDGSAGAGFSAASPEAWYAPAVNAAAANVADQEHDADSLLHTVRAMIAARKRSGAFATNTITWWDGHGTPAFAYWRGEPDAPERVLALHNLSDAPVTLALMTDAGALTDAITGEAAGGDVTLPAWGWRWLTAR